MSHSWQVRLHVPSAGRNVMHTATLRIPLVDGWGVGFRAPGCKWFLSRVLEILALKELPKRAALLRTREEACRSDIFSSMVPLRPVAWFGHGDRSGFDFQNQ